MISETQGASDRGPLACPCCGFLVFEEPPGSYEICPICDWENDGVQARAPGYRGGANKESLCEAQVIVVSRIGPGVQLYQGFRRALEWRPLAPEECTDEALPIASPFYWER